MPSDDTTHPDYRSKSNNTKKWWFNDPCMSRPLTSQFKISSH